MHERNLRLFVQSQAGLNEVHNHTRARVDIPGEYTGNAIVMGTHTISRDSTLIVRPQSHQRVRYYDPAHAGQRNILSNAPATEAPAPVQVEVVEEEINLQGFASRARVDASNPFADIGIIYADEDIIADEEEQDDTEKSNSDLNAPAVVDPDVIYAELLEKGVKNFGISKQELASFALTTRQVKLLYQDVTGKSPSTLTTGKMKRRIRDLADQSYSDFTRVMSAIKKVLKK